MKLLKNWTIEDAINAYNEGFDVVCGDGRIKTVTNMDREDK